MEHGCAFHRARIRKELSIADVAKSANVSRAAVSNWDRGISFPRRELALTLASILDIDADELQRTPPSYKSEARDDITDVFTDARRRLSRTLGVPMHRIKLSMSIDG